MSLKREERHWRKESEGMVLLRQWDKKGRISSVFFLGLNSFHSFRACRITLTLNSKAFSHLRAPVYILLQPFSRKTCDSPYIAALSRSRLIKTPSSPHKASVQEWNPENTTLWDIFSIVTVVWESSKGLSLINSSWTRIVKRTYQRGSHFLALSSWMCYVDVL